MEDKIDWGDFTRVVVSMGLFITILSTFLWVISIVVNPENGLFLQCAGFGSILVIEGTLASFFRVE